MAGSPHLLYKSSVSKFSYLSCMMRRVFCIFVVTLISWCDHVYAQSGLQKLDVHILEDLQAHRTPGQTAFWRTVSDANNYVDIGIPVTLLATGLIKNDVDMKKNALYVASSTAVSYLLDYAIKHLVKRPRPFVTNIHLRPVYRPGAYSFPSGHTSSSFGATVALSRAYPKWYVIAPSLLWSA